jgi:hypothetical protein
MSANYGVNYIYFKDSKNCGGKTDYLSSLINMGMRHGINTLNKMTEISEKLNFINFISFINNSLTYHKCKFSNLLLIIGEGWNGKNIEKFWY